MSTTDPADKQVQPEGAAQPAQGSPQAVETASGPTAADPASAGQLDAKERMRLADTALLAALVVGTPVPAAARKAGVSERTAWRRLKDPAFRQRLDEMRGCVLKTAADQAVAAVLDALVELRQIVRTHKRVNWRFKAAQAILHRAPEIHERAELEGRLRALETKAAEDDQALR
jgi:hypothetical protein